MDHEQEHMERAAWEALRTVAIKDLRGVLQGEGPRFIGLDRQVVELAEMQRVQLDDALRKYYAAEKWLAEHPAPF